MDTVGVRYIVDDVEAAVAFYTGQLGFEVVMRPAPTFAILSRDALRLMLSAPVGPGGAAQVMPDGRRPEPGGWNRISSRSATWSPRPRGCMRPACGCAATSSPASVPSRC